MVMEESQRESIEKLADELADRAINRQQFLDGLAALGIPAEIAERYLSDTRGQPVPPMDPWMQQMGVMIAPFLEKMGETERAANALKLVELANKMGKSVLEATEDYITALGLLRDR